MIRLVRSDSESSVLSDEIIVKKAKSVKPKPVKLTKKKQLKYESDSESESESEIQPIKNDPFKIPFDPNDPNERPKKLSNPTQQRRSVLNELELENDLDDKNIKIDKHVPKKVSKNQLIARMKKLYKNIKNKDDSDNSDKSSESSEPSEPSESDSDTSEDKSQVIKKKVPNKSRK